MRGPVRRVAEASRRVGRSLENRNLRLYLVGQGTSQTGMFVQQTAELWLILQITDSGVALGVHSALRYGPMLLFAAYGGLFVDRVNRWRLLVLTQSLHAVIVSILVVALWTTSPNLWLIYGVVLAQGIVNAVDNPLRRGFLRDLTTDHELVSAVGLLSSVQTLTQLVGAGIGGVMIAALGAKWCFTVNAVSYGAVVGALFFIDRSRLRAYIPIARGPGQIRDGLRFAWHKRSIRGTLLLAGLVSVFAWNWMVVLPVYSTSVFSGGASLYGFLIALLSAGSFVGGLLTARAMTISGRYLLGCGALLSGFLLLTASAPALGIALVGLFGMGAAGAAFVSAAQSRLQLNVDDVTSGRVLALWSVVFIGSKPLGGMLMGTIMDLAGPRTAFATGGTVTVLVLALTFLRSRNRDDDGD